MVSLSLGCLSSFSLWYCWYFLSAAQPCKTSNQIKLQIWHMCINFSLLVTNLNTTTIFSKTWTSGYRSRTHTQTVHCNNMIGGNKGQDTCHIMEGCKVDWSTCKGWGGHTFFFLIRGGNTSFKARQGGDMLVTVLKGFLKREVNL